MKLDWQQAAALLADARRVLILTHVKPDGDAIGSMLGLGQALQESGRAVLMAVDGGVPPDLGFLPGAGQVQAALNGTANADLVIAVDCGDEDRTGEVGQVARRSDVPLINLDHHATNTLFGDANLVDLQTAAAAEGVLDWLDQLGLPLSQPTATCLLTGLVTDTLCFRTDSVTATTFMKAQRLMEAGAPLSEIVQRTVSRTSYNGLRLWAQVLPKVQLEEHVIWAVITPDMYDEAGYAGTDDAGLVSMLVQADQAYVAAIFRVRRSGQIELGFRAVPGFDTSAVAVALGGGGHMLASGATVRGEPAETLVPRVIALLKSAVRAGSPHIS